MCYERHDHSHDYAPVTEAAPAPVAEVLAQEADEAEAEAVAEDTEVRQDGLVLTN